MFDPNSDTLTTRWDTDDDPNQGTIVLLQEEIARLEAELRARDDAPPPPTAPEPSPVRDHDAQVRIEALLVDLAERDEMVELLLEQSRLFEESATAQKAEWDQLHQWVDQVERRVDGRDGEGPRLREELDAERSRAESLRRAAESDRRDWGAQRVGLERETQLLRDQLARKSDGSDAREKKAFVELAAENRRLRTEAESSRKSADEAEDLGKRLDAALVELVEARRELREIADERNCERVEHEAEVGALRSELARESLRRQVEPVVAVAEAPAPARPSATDADERIRAFRQHLKDLHETEAARRVDRSMASRLSRLWKHTGPG